MPSMAPLSSPGVWLPPSEPRVGRDWNRGVRGEPLLAIVAAADNAVPALRRGGRMIHAGAGTSPAIGEQDGGELPPTDGWPADRLVWRGLDPDARLISAK